jgi:hypothetical protein
MRCPLFLFLAALGLLAACNGSSPATSIGDAAIADGKAESGSTEGGSDAAATDGCVTVGFDAGGYDLDAGAPIGSPCLPSEENSATFDGFMLPEISLASIAASGSPLCLVYHFRGLVTCPYGQSAAGQAPACAQACTTIGGQPVVGAVQPQCTNRRASEAVVWSCRCANAQGQTNDGNTYCTCPGGTTCTQAVSSIGASENDVSGAYCLPLAAVGDGGGGFNCSASCDPTSAPCP